MAEPGGVLGEIVRRKRVDVSQRLAGATFAARPTTRSLRAALARPGARFIMEVKRASPSGGSLRADADPAALARAYAPAAAAVSVLTDTPFFGGSLQDLAAVRAVFDGPLLAKDFMVDPRQVAEARAHGADAILVMLSVLDDREAAAMLAEAERFGMEALVEAHDEAEVRRAVALGAPIIGINNRNLQTLDVDLATTERLAHLVPADRLLVAESGIGSRADVERLARHADAFLVGSSLMKASDPGAAARALAYGRIKVCGLTRPEDVSAAAANGASYAGMVLVPGTPRAMTLREATPLAEAAHQVVLLPVGVFRDARLEEVALAARRMQLHAVQLHGSEDGIYIKGLRNLLGSGTEIWAASPVDREAALPRPGADRVLYDSVVDGRSGGTGRTFDWTQLAERPLDQAVVAGGLTPDNAGAAVRLGAFALDVSSGVEAAPGRKDPGKLAAFFEALRPRARKEAQLCD